MKKTEDKNPLDIDDENYKKIDNTITQSGK